MKTTMANMQRQDFRHFTLILLAAALLFLAGCANRYPNEMQLALPERERRPEIAAALYIHVDRLVGKDPAGSRSYLNPKKLDEAATYVECRLGQIAQPTHKPPRAIPYKVTKLPEAACSGNDAKETSDCKIPRPRPYIGGIDLKAVDPESPEAACRGNVARDSSDPLEFKNIELEFTGKRRPKEVVVVGAHYDSDACESGGCNPAADDNASGLAALIELAKLLKAADLDRTVRFVAFTNEEEPFFHKDSDAIRMGSMEYARRTSRPDEEIVAMLSLESIGYYSDVCGSQESPWLLDKLVGMPKTGNFIGFVGNWRSEELLKDSLDAFRGKIMFPSEGFVTYSWVPGVNWSDHWSYWKLGVPALMITDTAPNRNKCYHKPCDTPDRLDYDRMARVVVGLAGVVEKIANEKKRWTP